ncbi:hypothetical protein L2D01_13035 [Hyphomonadaceae bacterium ML37]|nr:hypothetical protein L2D01_13035 [Hyphomonadaceae bacterium ML37]
MKVIAKVQFAAIITESFPRNKRNFLKHPMHAGAHSIARHKRAGRGSRNESVISVQASADG